MTLKEAVRLSDLAAAWDLRLDGPDLEIVTFGALNTRSPSADRMLTWVVDEGWLPELERKGIGACLTHESLAGRLGERSLLLTDQDPTETFYSIFLETTKGESWQIIESTRGENVRVAPTAMVHDGVQIGNDCTIMDQAVVLPNSRLGDRVTVKPHATIGGDGFEVRLINGTPTTIPHRGGVWIGDDVHIGSQTCVDRGMFGGLTEIGDRTKLDNLIHVGHSASLGNDGIVAACTEIGTIVAEDGFWLGPRCAVLQAVRLGHHSYVGIGSVIVRDIPPHALAYGVPARQHGWVCECRTKLEFDGDHAECPSCSREYSEVDGSLTAASVDSVR